MMRVSTVEVQPRAQAALAGSPILELRVIKVQSRDLTLMLSGRVSSFYHKQLAQEVVRAICRECDKPDIELVNSIRVD
jgi:osmotically-inducible protein OsmY